MRLLSGALSSGPTLDLRDLLTVGEAARLPEILIPSPEDPCSTNADVLEKKMRASIERLTASMIDRQSRVSDHTAGFYVTTDYVGAARSATKYTFQAEVTEVTPTEAMFRVKVCDSNSGAIIGIADYQRVIVGEVYRPRL
jgi:hypothetical protein